MTLNIPRDEWGRFFDDLTKRRFEWRTNIEVMSREFGHQYLTEGLPLRGITCEAPSGRPVIEILLGDDADHHQTHNLMKAEEVAFLPDEDGPGGILEIEETDGTKTLVHIVEPMPIESGYGAFRVAAGQKVT